MGRRGGSQGEEESGIRGCQGGGGGLPDGTGLSLATTCHPSVQRLGHQDKLKKKKFGQKERKKGLMTVWILVLVLILMIKSTWQSHIDQLTFLARHCIALQWNITR